MYKEINKQLNENVDISLYLYAIALSLDINCDGCPCGVMVKALDCGILVSEFELQLGYYVYFWTIIPYPPIYGLNTTVASRRMALALNNPLKLINNRCFCDAMIIRTENRLGASSSSSDRCCLHYFVLISLRMTEIFLASLQPWCLVSLFKGISSEIIQCQTHSCKRAAEILFKLVGKGFNWVRVRKWT